MAATREAAPTDGDVAEPRGAFGDETVEVAAQEIVPEFTNVLGVALQPLDLSVPSLLEYPESSSGTRAALVVNAPATMEITADEPLSGRVRPVATGGLVVDLAFIGIAGDHTPRIRVLR